MKITLKAFVRVSARSLYKKKSLSVLCVQCNNTFRTLLRLPRFSSASEMFAQARMDCFHAIIHQQKEHISDEQGSRGRQQNSNMSNVLLLFGDIF